VFYYADEFNVSWLPTLQALWSPKGQQVSAHEYWTVSDLKIGVERWFGVVYQSLESYYTLLHQSGFSLQRPAKVYRSRPNERAMADFEAALEKN